MKRRKSLKIGYETSSEVEVTAKVNSVSQKPKKALKNAKLKQHLTDDSFVGCEASEKVNSMYKQHLKNIEEMRASNDAPVDRVGCHQLADKKSEPNVYRFQVLVALMLSSQTKDQVTADAMQRLRNHGCNVENICQTSEETLRALITPVGFYKRKAIYLRKTAAILRDEYDGDIPDSVDALCKLPGVGPKMAHLTMQVAWDRIEGIGVDTHVHRIANRLAWVSTKTPEDTRVALEAFLPRDRWKTVNKLLVGFGQQICLPIGPKCMSCLNKDICSFAKRTSKKKHTKC
ncbi:hypothetical protein AB6A40_005546 [Gnathostoma spinigerum]|uniref:Endonuclease III homolog n=1 Tax=Gnathostoma spinigerum TaxID=75299 RepID=A0ABD6EHY3_9BILA